MRRLRPLLVAGILLAALLALMLGSGVTAWATASRAAMPGNGSGQGSTLLPNDASEVMHKSGV